MNYQSLLARAAILVAAFFVLSRLDTGRLEVTRSVQAQEPTAAAAAAAPDIFFEEAKYEFGEIFDDQKVHHTFKVQNKGTADLQIGDVRGSCGCTVGEMSSKTIPPGGEASLEVTFDPKFKKGPQNKTVTIQSNDPDSPSSTLALTGSVKTHFEIDPVFISFGNNLPKGQAVEQKVKIWSGTNEPFEITKAESDNEKVIAKFNPIEENGRKGYELSATLAADTPPGRYAGNLKLLTNSTASPELGVRYFATIDGSLRVNPKYAVMGQVPVGQESTKILTIETVEAQPLQIVKVNEPAPYIKAQLKTLEEGKRFELSVSITKDAPQGALRGEIEIETNYTDEGVLKIPVFGFVGEQEESSSIEDGTQ